MTEYLVFPVPVGCVKVKASGIRAARNKHRKEFPALINEELIIVPVSHGNKTFGDEFIPLWKSSVRKVE
jgi:hypothetical protein